MKFSDAFGFVLKSIGGVSYSRRFAWTGYTKKEKKMPPKWKYFKPQEVEGLNEEFVAKLDEARHLAGVPFIITSGLRSPEKNQSVVGAVPESAHLKGLAVDLRARSSQEVAKIVDAAKTVGIFRRGIYVDRDFKPIHIHLDDDPEKLAQTGPVIFIKREANA